MVTDLLTYVTSNDMDEIDIAAGIAIHPTWSEYDPASDWVKEYSDQTVSYIYNFGSTDGYPAVPTGTPTPEVPPPWDYSPWTTEQLYAVSWGIPGTLPFPQLYHPQYARNWYAVKRWSFDSSLDVMQFAGEISQCLSSPCANEEEKGVYFTPEQGWQMLWQEVNADPDEDMHQDLDLSTDTGCSNASTVTGCAP